MKAEYEPRAPSSSLATEKKESTSLANTMKEERRNEKKVNPDDSPCVPRSNCLKLDTLSFSSHKSINYISALIIWVKFSISVEGILWWIQRLLLIFYLAILNFRNTSEILELLCPQNSPGKNTRMGCRSLLQGNLPTQGLNPGLLQCRHILYCLTHQESPNIRNTLEISELAKDKFFIKEFDEPQFSSVQLLSCIQLFAIPWIAARQASLSITNSRSSLKLTSIESVMPSSVVPFSSCPQSLPASESFPMSQLFPWGGQSTVVSALASVLPMNTQDWSTLGWTGWISLQSKRFTRVFNTTVQKHQFFTTQLSSSPTLTSIHDHWKNHSLD